MIAEESAQANLANHFPRLDNQQWVVLTGTFLGAILLSLQISWHSQTANALPSLTLGFPNPSTTQAKTVSNSKIHPAVQIDPNQASQEEWESLPGIGPVLAKRIIEARSSEPFRSIEDLDVRVNGIGPKTVERLRPFLRFEVEPTPGDSLEEKSGSE